MTIIASKHPPKRGVAQGSLAARLGGMPKGPIFGPRSALRHGGQCCVLSLILLSCAPELTNTPIHTTIQEVKVPVPVPCKAMVNRPTFADEQIAMAGDIFEQTLAQA